MRPCWGKRTTTLGPNTVREVSHPVTWWVTTKATSRTFDVTLTSAQSAVLVTMKRAFVCRTVLELMADQKKKNHTALLSGSATLQIHFKGTAAV